jgi:hypothetical protein
VAAAVAGGELEPIVGLHLYMFGGTRKSAEWLNGARARADVPAAVAHRGAAS